MTTSQLVGKSKWGPETLPCRLCGFHPVGLETTLDSGAKEFFLICPNNECAEHWKSPVTDLRKDSSGAAEAWNKANL